MKEILINGIFVGFEKKAKGQDMSQFHYHNFYELYYLHSGSRRYIVNNKIYDLKAGDIIIIDQNEIHITKNLNKNGEYERYLLYITKETLHSLGDNCKVFESIFGNKVVSLKENDIQHVSQIFEKLLKHFNSSDMFSRQLIINNTYEICTIIYNAIKNNNSGTGKVFYDNNIDKALWYIYDNFRDYICLEDAAKICNMNKSYFSRYFKKITGIGFNNYVTTLRIKEATSLLKNSNMTISEVAEKSGFDSLQHFCAVFKKETGINAGKFRKNLQFNFQPQYKKD